MLVLAVVGIAMSAGLASINSIYAQARRTEQANAAVALLKKARADALASSSGAAIETIADTDGVGVQVTVAIIRPDAGKKPCQDWPTRSIKTETVRFDLLDFKVDRRGADPNLLCFEAGGFRLIDTDGFTQALAPVDIDLFPNVLTQKVTVQPTGTINSTLDSSGFIEGMAVTVNSFEAPPADDPSRNLLSPDKLEPDLVFVETTAVVAPTEPGTDPALEPMPVPVKVVKPPPGGCTVNADCGGGGAVCSGGLCEMLAFACSSDCDCGADEFCSGGTCVYGGCNTAACPFTGCNSQCQYVECCMLYGCMCA